LRSLKAKEELVKRTRGIVQENRITMAAFLNTYPSLFRWMHPHPNAATQSTISLVELLGTETTAAFCDRVVQSTGVLLMPGELFELPRFFRIGLGAKLWRAHSTHWHRRSASRTVRRVHRRSSWFC
jgi:aspartate/methionine/tyrosine aminotransferase